MSIIKPLSGSASTALFTDIVKTTGPDSMASKMTAVIMGSAETTFYVLAVYLGAINIKKSRYLVPVCLVADVVGIIVAVRNGARMALSQIFSLFICVFFL